MLPLVSAFPIRRRFVYVVLPVSGNRLLAFRRWSAALVTDEAGDPTLVHEDVEDEDEDDGPPWQLPSAEVPTSGTGDWLFETANQALAPFSLALAGPYVPLIQWVSPGGILHVVVRALSVQPIHFGTWLGGSPPPFDPDTRIEQGTISARLTDAYLDSFRSLIQDMRRLLDPMLHPSIEANRPEGFLFLVRSGETVHMQCAGDFSLAKLPTFDSEEALQACAAELGVEGEIGEVGGYRDARGVWMRVVCARVEAWVGKTLPARTEIDEETQETVEIPETVDIPAHIGIHELHGDRWAVFGPLVEARMVR